MQLLPDSEWAKLAAKADGKGTKVARRWPSGTYLHGAPKKFDRLLPNVYGAIFFSDPTRFRGRKTQAEVYAELKEGWVAEVQLKPGKFFNPWDDPVADQIRQDHAKASIRSGGPTDKTIVYQDSPAIIKAATPLGYNRFEFYESAFRTYSEVVTDPSLVKIVRWHKAGTTRTAAKFKNKKQVDKADGSGKTTVYEYSEGQVQHRNREKAKRIEGLRKGIDKLRSQVSKDLTAKDEKTRVTALAIALIDETFERVGNPGSAKEGHYGVTGWLSKHVTFSGGKATLKYVGKSGVKQEKTVSNAKVVKALKAATKAGGDAICQGDDCTITASEVNAYLKPFDVTAKDLRGFHANTEMQTRLKAVRSKGGKLPTDKKEREKKLKDEFKTALEETASAVGHEASTLKSQYLVPGLEDSYLKDGKVTDKLDKKGSSGPVMIDDVRADFREAVQEWKTFKSVLERSENPEYLWESNLLKGVLGWLQKLISRSNVGEFYGVYGAKDVPVIGKRAVPLQMMIETRDGAKAHGYEWTIVEVDKLLELVATDIKNVAPERFSYKGVTILNPHGFDDTAIGKVLDAIAYLEALFKKRGVADLFYQSLKSVSLVIGGFASAMRGVAGSYTPSTRELELDGRSLRSTSGRMLNNWVHEVVLHEVAHHLHLSLLPRDAKAVWDAPWEAVKEKVRPIRDYDRTVSSQDAKRFWDLLVRYKGKLPSIRKGLSPEDHLKFHMWLANAGLVGEKSVSWLKRSPSWAHWGHTPGKTFAGLLANPPTEEGPQKRLERTRERLLRSFTVESSNTAKKVFLNTVMKPFKKLVKKLDVPTGYAGTNEAEDFAESFVAFMDAPSKLSDNAMFRMKRTLSLAGLYGKPIMRIGLATDEEWDGFLREAGGTRTLYHIGKRPAQPRPNKGWIHTGPFKRSWLPGLTFDVGVFLSSDPLSVAKHHGVLGHVYAYKVPWKVIVEAGGLHRYDNATEIIIPENLWDQVRFAGKSMDKDELKEKVWGDWRHTHREQARSTRKDEKWRREREKGRTPRKFTPLQKRKQWERDLLDAEGDRSEAIRRRRERRIATKSRAEKEDEATEKLVRKAPKKKPPRHDLRKERVESEEDPDFKDKADATHDKDLSKNYKRIGAKDEAHKPGDVWRTSEGKGPWAGMNPDGDTQTFTKDPEGKEKAQAWAKGKEISKGDEDEAKGDKKKDEDKPKDKGTGVEDLEDSFSDDPDALENLERLVKLEEQVRPDARGKPKNLEELVQNIGDALGDDEIAKQVMESKGVKVDEVPLETSDVLEMLNADPETWGLEQEVKEDDFVSWLKGQGIDPEDDVLMEDILKGMAKSPEGLPLGDEAKGILQKKIKKKEQEGLKAPLAELAEMAQEHRSKGIESQVDKFKDSMEPFKNYDPRSGSDDLLDDVDTMLASMEEGEQDRLVDSFHSEMKALESFGKEGFSAEEMAAAAKAMENPLGDAGLSTTDRGKALARSLHAKKVLANPRWAGGTEIQRGYAATPEELDKRTEAAFNQYVQAPAEIRKEAAKQLAAELEMLPKDAPEREELERVADSLALASAMSGEHGWELAVDTVVARRDEDGNVLKDAEGNVLTEEVKGDLRTKPSDEYIALAKMAQEQGNVDMLLKGSGRKGGPEQRAATREVMQDIFLDPSKGLDKLDDFFSERKDSWGDGWGNTVQWIKDIRETAEGDPSDPETRKARKRLATAQWAQEVLVRWGVTSMTTGQALADAPFRKTDKQREQMQKTLRKALVKNQNQDKALRDFNECLENAMTPEEMEECDKAGHLAVLRTTLEAVKEAGGDLDPSIPVVGQALKTLETGNLETLETPFVRQGENPKDRESDVPLLPEEYREGAVWKTESGQWSAKNKDGEIETWPASEEGAEEKAQEWAKKSCLTERKPGVRLIPWDAALLVN
jgi:hypothetical protein